MLLFVQPWALGLAHSRVGAQSMVAVTLHKLSAWLPHGIIEVHKVFWKLQGTHALSTGDTGRRDP